MKKSILVGSLILSLIINVYLYNDSQTKYEVLKDNETNLKGEVFNLSEEIREFGYDIEDNQILIEDLTEAVKSYESLVLSLLENKEDTFDFINSAYRYKMTYELDDMSFEIPDHGKIYTDANRVIVKLEVVKPPHFDNRVIDYEFHNNNVTPLIRQIDYGHARILDFSDNHIDFEIDLENRDTFFLELTGMFKKAFDVDYDHIEIIKYASEDLTRGSDYFPSERLMSFFSGENIEFSFEYLPNKGELIADGDFSDTLEMEINGYVKLINTEGADLSSMVLPAHIFLNQYFMQRDLLSVVTDTDIEVEVPAGLFTCIELTTYSGDQVVERSYYAKEIGYVKMIFRENVYELIKYEKKSQ
ncbi:hypothetical protein EZV73_11555 [Acidaminobacter sp. JC074]|uniref:hypothetical protein n=1 Tax=Acidaminobacter sp. JC074 TaxID=2530199 RepID=UPI001F0DC912|nr:hypothetical protein [Acidaminobacter sp. JC074]MCH4888214.1 hypothetical protein [Acidaminobacter sp. JC074]